MEDELGLGYELLEKGFSELTPEEIEKVKPVLERLNCELKKILPQAAVKIGNNLSEISNTIHDLFSQAKKITLSKDFFAFMKEKGAFQKSESPTTGIPWVDWVGPIPSLILLLQFLLKQEKERKITTLIKCGLHAETQKFGKQQSEVLKLLEDRPETVETSIDTVGFNLSFAEQTALFALQEIMSRRNYKGAAEREGKPIYSATVAEYLEAYGVSKRTTKRGKNEFLSNERQESLEALKSLKERKFYIFYEKKYLEKGKVKYDILKFEESIIRTIERFERLTESERAALKIGDKDIKSKKLTHIVFVPHQVLFDQIDTYFCLKDADYRKLLRDLAGQQKGKGKNSRFVGQFIDWLYYQAAHRKKSGDMVIKIGLEELAVKLRMDADIKNRRWYRIRARIQEAIDIAMKLEFISDYQQQPGQNGQILEVFTLNERRFSPVSLKNSNTKEIKVLEDKQQKHRRNRL